MAITWTLFHYGISGWSMYALMGMALGYFSFRHGLPLSIRSALYPIIGKRVHGPSATRWTWPRCSAPSSASPPAWASASCS